MIGTDNGALSGVPMTACERDGFVRRVCPVEIITDLNPKLETREGAKFDIEKPPERDVFVLRAMKDDLEKQHPKVRFRSLTARYNCVGMVFASRRGAIQPMHLLQILKTDGFRKLPNESMAHEGDVVVYESPDFSEPTHVGVLIWKNGIILSENEDVWWVLSKWGEGGPEYIHLLTDVPKVFGSPTQFWSERRIS